ncbi:phytoene desaturase family protein [Autumnicola musiva]|uniref:NAD(P)/FAD-dependent oxidoreductase n=1 Tax=Autumnicola musiva TaxID=3075589 RepID=A0ABU3D8J2_9FLAO|nr:NAD(P)/FAD-dependent oxidoreductase [Zunongwangia sp. F117]MDT0677849.1 NAD(P)/FAD-dependent oxidoreductase [Zunongwangia sp. F117]
MGEKYDAIIIGSGSNGISAAIHLQQKGLKTAIFEQASIPGGATKTLEVTLPGFKHDIGSSILPLGYASPFLRTLPLGEHGLEWIFPDIPYSHPFNDGSALACYKDIDRTAAQLLKDEKSYKKLFGSIVNNWPELESNLLGPLKWPDHPVKLMKFGLKAFVSAHHLVNHYFKDEKTRVFFYGSAAHSTLSLNSVASSSFGLVLNILAHKYGWPFPKGGANKFTEALLSYYKSKGGELFLNTNITDIDQLPEAKTYMFDLTPKQLLEIKGTRFTSLYRKRMENFKYGAGVFKMDWALSEPIPWLNEKCRKSGTVHLGYSQKEIERSENSAKYYSTNKNPYVLLAQHTLFDSTRAPENKHTAWAYCHVPNGSTRDYTAEIEAQIEKAAPGFKNCILAKSTMNTQALQHFNPNLVGGDINGGSQNISQLFTRPVTRLSPYTTPDPRVYICSSSTPPGGGVHGMGGFSAAKKLIQDHFQDLI